MASNPTYTSDEIAACAQSFARRINAGDTAAAGEYALWVEALHKAQNPGLTQGQVEAIVAAAIRNHEARFSVSGAAIALVAVVIGLMSTGRF